MRTHIAIAIAGVAAATLLAARPAEAQRPAAADVVRPDVHGVADLPSAARPVASYRLRTTSGAGLPSQVVVADSAGLLVARLHDAGSRAAQAMTVTVMGTDLVLQGQSAAGTLTLLLAGQNDADAASHVDGRWSLGERQGTLRGRARR